MRDYVQSHVIPKSALPGQPLPVQQHVFPKNAPPGLPPPVPDPSSAPQPRVPLDQRLTSTGQAQVASQFTAAGALNDGFVPPSSSQRSRDDNSSNDGLTPPSPSQCGDKGKRGSSYQGSRNQPPTKFSKVITPVTLRRATAGETTRQVGAHDRLLPETIDQVLDRQFPNHRLLRNRNPPP